jgi:hypothetical protein
MNSTVDIGSKLRGIRDDQTGAKDVTNALILSADMPVKILQTDWQSWGKALFKKDMPAWFHYVDFEFQLSPILDAALTYNSETGRSFALEDGWYGAGLEALVYPDKFRAITVRAGFYIDAGRFFLEDYIDTSWRDSPSRYEVFVGIGVQY